MMELDGLPEGWKLSPSSLRQGSLLQRPPSPPSPGAEPRSPFQSTLSATRILAHSQLKFYPHMSLSVDGGDVVCHNTLESAFSHMKHESVDSAVRALLAVLRHAGLPRAHESAAHPLVGRPYCIAYTNGAGRKVSLFGEVAACVVPGPQDGEGEDGSLLLVRYDGDSLAAARVSGSGSIGPIQLVNCETAYGGCVMFERLAGRGSTAGRPSVVSSIDRATAVETWIAPDVRLEGGGGGGAGDSRDPPELTLLAGGYKFNFKARFDGDGKSGVYATCSPLGGVRSAGHQQQTASAQSQRQPLGLRPGELIDLGTVPADSTSTRSIPSFIAKNYVHGMRPGEHAILICGSESVYDMTDDGTGDLLRASSCVSVHAAKCRDADDVPTLHVRLDPEFNVHVLFGVPYRGSWSEYEIGMGRLLPLFAGGGGEVEVKIDRYNGLGTRLDSETRYVQAMRAFGPDEVVDCVTTLLDIYGEIEGSSDRQHSGRRGRLASRLQTVARIMERRIRELAGPPGLVAEGKGGGAEMGGVRKIDGALTERLRKLIDKLGDV